MVEETGILMLEMVDLVVAHLVQDLIPLLVVVVMKEVILHQKEMLAVVQPTGLQDMEEVAVVVPVVPVVLRSILAETGAMAEMEFAFLQHLEILKIQ